VAKPIFARFVLAPVEGPTETLAIDLQRKFLNGLEPREFENLLEKKNQELLRTEFNKKDKTEYNELMKEILRTGNIDLIFSIKITDEGKDKKKIALVFSNTEKRVLYIRESIYDYRTVDQYHLRLERWMQEFKNLLPPVGQIVNRGNGQVNIKVIHGSLLEDFESRPFHVGKFNFDLAIENRIYTPNGAITDSKSRVFKGYIDKKFRGKPYRAGDYVIFLDKVQKGSLIEDQGDITVSETWFNYLNSPEFSLLDCTLLPLIGSAPQLKLLHKNLVEVINQQKLCKFRTDKGLGSLLEKYDENLEEYFNNEDVLRYLAKILRAGALFRLGVYQISSGVSIKFDVVAENGKTIYFSKYTVIEGFDNEYITELLLGWILEYKKSLPLSGKVVQIRGETLLIDIPSGLVEGSKKEFKIIRPISFRYEDIGRNRKLTWKKEVIAYGKILRVKKLHSIGTIFKLKNPENKVKEGDWVYIQDLDYNVKEQWYLKKIYNLKKDRGIGRAKISTEFSSVSTKSNSKNILGLGLGFDFFLPSGFIFSGEATRNVNGGDQSISNNSLTAAVGYSFTPRFFSDYFSFIDLYLGYRSVNYQVGNLEGRGIGDLKFAGMYIGSRTDIPIYKKFSIQLQANYVPSDKVVNDNELFGDAKRSFGVDGFIIGKYKLNKTSRLFVEYHQKFYDTVYEVDDVNLTINASLIKLGYGVDF
jgi:hypothetical protein